METDGFDGYMIHVQVVKSKTNRSGRVIELIFDHSRGFDPWKTNMNFCSEHKLISGRNPYCYFKSNPDLKFSTKVPGTKEVIDEMAKAMYPYLYELLDDGSISQNNEEMSPETLDALIDKAYTDEPEEATA